MGDPWVWWGLPEGRPGHIGEHHAPRVLRSGLRVSPVSREEWQCPYLWEPVVGVGRGRGQWLPAVSAVTGHLREPAARLKLGEVCPAGRARARGAGQPLLLTLTLTLTRCSYGFTPSPPPPQGPFPGLS